MDNILQFPDITDAGIVFGGYPEEWFSEVMKIEKPKDYKKWADMAENLFFSGGSIPINKKLDKGYVLKGIRALKAVLGSFKPKHEHKEYVCALILKSICE